MTDLPERLARLADAGAAGVDLDRPDAARSARPWWRTGPALAGAAALAVAAAATVAVLSFGGGGGRDDLAVGDEPGSGTSDAAVAVTHGDASIGTEPVDLRLRFLDAGGEVIATRAWSEIEQPVGGGAAETVVMGGLVQRVPPGELQLEATLGGADPEASCTQAFSASAGDRLILRLQLGATGSGPDCARVEPVEDWVEGRTGATGAAYVGLTQAEAEERAAAEGLTTRVVAADGMDLAITMDLQPNRLNLVLFDGIVVAARLDDEPAMPDPPALPPLEPRPAQPSEPGGEPGAAPPGDGTLVVDLEPVEAVFVEGFDVTLRVYGHTGDLLAEREWSEAVAEGGATTDPGGGVDPYVDPYYMHVLREAVPAGTIRLVTFMRISPGGSIPPPEGPGCETTVEVGAADATRITLLFGEDERGACAAVASANAEADRLLGMPRGLPAPGFVGLTEGEADDEATARGWSVRVLARDGEGGVRTDDYQPERVNLVIEGGVVTAAART